MGEETAAIASGGHEKPATADWRRDPGYFLAGTLLLFLFQAAAIAVSTPNIPARPHVVIFSAWAAFLAIRIVRKRRENQLLKNAVVTIEPQRPNLGNRLVIALALNPSTRHFLRAWSVSLVCVQAGGGDQFGGAGLLCTIERIQHVDQRLAPNEAYRSEISLVLPSDVPATGQSGDWKFTWHVEINVELGGSPVWGLEQPFPLIVLV